MNEYYLTPYEDKRLSLLLKKVEEINSEIKNLEHSRAKYQKKTKAFLEKILDKQEERRREPANMRIL